MEAGLLCESDSHSQFPDYPSLEQTYLQYLAKNDSAPPSDTKVKGSILLQEIQKAREHIKSSLDNVTNSRALETSRLDDLEATVNTLVERISQMEVQINKLKSLDDAILEASAATPVTDAPKKEKTDDDDIDLFASGSEDEAELAKVKAERIAEYDAKKSKKPAPVAKSNIILDVKPWGDETDLKEVERLVRSIQTDGLLWGQSKLVPLAYGINKLQIACVVEDDKVGTDFLEEAITAFEDHVQSVDIASFQKV